jgi:hypothetical protein
MDTPAMPCNLQLTDRPAHFPEKICPPQAKGCVLPAVAIITAASAGDRTALRSFLPSEKRSGVLAAKSWP